MGLKRRHPQVLTARCCSVGHSRYAGHGLVCGLLTGQLQEPTPHVYAIPGELRSRPKHEAAVGSCRTSICCRGRRCVRKSRTHFVDKTILPRTIKHKLRKQPWVTYNSRPCIGLQPSTPPSRPYLSGGARTPSKRSSVQPC